MKSAIKLYDPTFDVPRGDVCGEDEMVSMLHTEPEPFQSAWWL